MSHNVMTPPKPKRIDTTGTYKERVRSVLAVMFGDALASSIVKPSKGTR